MSDSSPVCPSCGNRKHALFRRNCRDIVCRCPGEWSLFECKGCGLIYTSPSLSPSELLTYYPPEYSSYNPVGSLCSNSLASLFRYMVMWPYILRFGSPDWQDKSFGRGHLLDVGCGAGMFMKKASVLGWYCWGIDISPMAVRIAQTNVPRATVSVATLDELNSNAQFDFINMSHVLEHLFDPRKALQRCFALLVPGGKLRVSIPNIGSLEAKFFGPYWRGLDVPRHLIHLRPPVIERLLQDVGFVAITNRPAMLASSISESLLLTLPETFRYRLLGSRIARLLYLSMILPASLSYLLGNAGAIEVMAQKP